MLSTVLSCVFHFIVRNDKLMNDRNSTLYRWTHSLLSCRELNPVGSRALSHDSIFIPEEPVVDEPGLDHSMSQENVSDKVRNLQVCLTQTHSQWLNISLCSAYIYYSLYLFIYFLLTTQKQIAQGIKFGQRPPSLRRSEGDEGSSDEEEVPRSPLKVLAQVEAEPPKTEPQVTLTLT